MAENVEIGFMSTENYAYGIYLDDVTVSEKKASELEIEFRHNVEFDNNIAMHYAIKKSDLEGYSDLKLVIDKEVYEKNVATPTVKRCVLENPTTYYIDDEEYWHFVFPGVAASEMGNVLEAQLTCTIDGINYASKKETYSVKAYAYERLASTTKATYRTLLVDMLNYGAAAQIHFGKNAANPVNADLTDIQKGYASSWDDVEITQAANLIELNGATAFFDKKNVLFDNKVELAHLITFSSNQKMDNVKIVFTYDNGKGEKTLTVPASKFEKNGDAYVAYCDCLTPAEMGCTVSATIYDGSKAISGTLQYGIEAYAADRLQLSSSTTYKDLMKKMVMYGRATKAHFSQLSNTGK